MRTEYCELPPPAFKTDGKEDEKKTQEMINEEGMLAIEQDVDSSNIVKVELEGLNQEVEI